MRIYVAFILVLLVISSGCIGVEEFESEKPTVDENTLNSTGYELTSQDEFEVEESRQILGEQRGAIIRSHIHTYEKSAEDLNLNFTQEQLDSQLENQDIEQLLQESNVSITDILSEDELIRRIAENSDQYTEDQLQLLLDQSGQNIESFVDESNISVDEYLNRTEVLEYVDPDTAEQAIDQSNYNTSGSVYVVISTPSAGVLGTELNPLVLASSEDLLEQVNERTEQNLSIGERQGSETITNNQNQTVVVEEYPVTVETDSGATVESTLLLSINENANNSVLVSVGIYPDFADERSDLLEIIRSTSV